MLMKQGILKKEWHFIVRTQSKVLKSSSALLFHVMFMYNNM